MRDRDPSILIHLVRVGRRLARLGSKGEFGHTVSVHLLRIGCEKVRSSALLLHLRRNLLVCIRGRVHAVVVLARFEAVRRLAERSVRSSIVGRKDVGLVLRRKHVKIRLRPLEAVFGALARPKQLLNVPFLYLLLIHLLRLSLVRISSVVSLLRNAPLVLLFLGCVVGMHHPVELVPTRHLKTISFALILIRSREPACLRDTLFVAVRLA